VLAGPATHVPGIFYLILWVSFIVGAALVVRGALTL
jgi:hypothetical protein